MSTVRFASDWSIDIPYTPAPSTPDWSVNIFQPPAQSVSDSCENNRGSCVFGERYKSGDENSEFVYCHNIHILDKNLFSQLTAIDSHHNKIGVILLAEGGFGAVYNGSHLADGPKFSFFIF